MPLRTRILIVVILGLIAIAGIAGIVYWSKNKKAAIPAGNQAVTSSSETDSDYFVPTNQTKPAEIPAGTPIKQLTTLEMQQNAAKQLAKIFIERYNSYSTENNYQNILDSRSLVTDALWNKISQLLNKPTSENFVGVTAEVLSATSVNWSDNQAEYLVKTRRTTEKDGVKSEQYQDVKVVLKKIGTPPADGWLVDNFTVIVAK